MRTAAKVSIAVALAAIRIMGHKSLAFQATAHLFIGGLIAAAFVEGEAVETETDAVKYTPLIKENCMLVVVLSVIELGCFLFQKFLV